MYFNRFPTFLFIIIFSTIHLVTIRLFSVLWRFWSLYSPQERAPACCQKSQMEALAPSQTSFRSAANYIIPNWIAASSAGTLLLWSAGEVFTPINLGWALYTCVACGEGAPVLSSPQKLGDLLVFNSGPYSVLTPTPLYLVGYLIGHPRDAPDRSFKFPYGTLSMVA